MSPTPLSSNLVHLTLQYISPPSQLDRSLPPHLLSKSLLQRHHFLRIEPENASEYLSWPSESSSRAIQLLELRPASHDDAPPSYSIQYTSDAEHTLAHVSLPETEVDGQAVRLVFQWDTDAWKFHDTKLMPFPPGSSVSLQEALAGEVNTASSRALSSTTAPQCNPCDIDHGDDGSDDDYWNAYGVDDDDTAHRELQKTKDAAGDSEDAYWARYSSVHGTADSTIPTPPVMRRKQVYTYSDSDSQDPLPVPTRQGASDTPDIALHIPHMLRDPPQWMYHNPRWDPASAADLARLLSEISPRQSPPHSAAVLPDFEDNLELSPPLVGSSSDDSDTLSPPDDLGLISVATAGARNEVAVMDGVAEAGCDYDSDTPVVGDEEPLRQGLKGLYALWQMSRSQKGLSSEEDHKRSFMRVVEEVVQTQ